MAKERIILGIDPGTSIMGYGLLKEKHSRPEIITLGEIDLSKYKDHYIKLKRIFDRTIQLIEDHSPDELAIEAPFYGRNVQSMLKLGRAQGVAISAALSRTIPIFEYAPRKIKQSITGGGNASKQQVAVMLQKTVGLQEIPKNLDGTDGLAAALCHFYQRNAIDKSSNYSSWEAFINQNPGRIIK